MHFTNDSLLNMHTVSWALIPYSQDSQEIGNGTSNLSYMDRAKVGWERHKYSELLRNTNFDEFFIHISEISRYENIWHFVSRSFVKLFEERKPVKLAKRYLN